MFLCFFICICYYENIIIPLSFIYIIMANFKKFPPIIYIVYKPFFK
nr:MAG TPA: hypothetical protein [Caudoviricetes sp.]